MERQRADERGTEREIEREFVGEMDSVEEGERQTDRWLYACFMAM